MKTKFTFMLLGALVLGILIGVLVTGRYTRHKVVQIKEMGTPEGLHRHFYKLIDPSEEQEELIRPILRTYATQSQEMRQRHWDEHKALFKQVQQELEPLLDEEQLERLENFKNRSPMQGQMKRDSYRKHKKGRSDEYDKEVPKDRRYRNRGN
jgi:hypothetical protein